MPVPIDGAGPYWGGHGMNNPHNPYPQPTGPQQGWAPQPQGGFLPPPVGFAPQPFHQPGGFPPNPAYPPQSGYGQPLHPGYGHPGHVQPAGERESLMAAYIGPKAPDYLAAFRRMDMAGGKISFSGFAFFFNILWLAYRKLYVQAAIAAAAATLPVILAILTMAKNGKDAEVVMAVGASICGIAVAAVIGLLGRSMVRKRGEAEITRAMHARPDPHGRMMQVAAAGNTSIAGLVIAWIGYAILVTIMSLAGAG